MHGGLGGLSPAAALERWSGTPRLLGALAARGDLSVTGVWRAPAGTPPTVLERDGVTYCFVPDATRLARKVAATVAALRPDVVHINGMVFPLPTMALRHRCGRATVVLVQHHGGLPGRGRHGFAQRRASRCADGWIFTGGAQQAAPWRDQGFVPAGRPVYPALEASTDLVPVPYDQARRHTGMWGRPAVLWVGRLLAGKDPLAALDGFARFVTRSGAAPSSESPADRARSAEACPSGAGDDRDRGWDPQLWMACTDRDLEPAVRAFVAASPALAGRAHLVGPVPAAEMAAWYSGADLYLSTSHHEGSGYALIEAIACGCTPVVTEIPPHVAIAGDLGARFPTGDAATLAAALDAVAARTGPDQRRVARRRFDTALTWHVAAAELADAYHAALAAK